MRAGKALNILLIPFYVLMVVFLSVWSIATRVILELGRAMDSVADGIGDAVVGIYEEIRKM